MNVLVKQFLGENYSWSHVGWGISRALISAGHDVDLFSTDGLKHTPADLKGKIIGYCEKNSQKVIGNTPSKTYDMQISYTTMKNFPYYLSNGSKNRFGIWCYEWAGKNILPNGFAKHYKYCDKILAPSSHAKQVFIDSGVPASHVEVIPHGVDDRFINGNDVLNIKCDRKFKILANIAQPHVRKNIPGVLEAFGKAFTNKDDVALILKVVIKKPESVFDVDVNELLNSFYKKYKNHAKVVVLSNYIEDISSLYRACDAYFSMSMAESFLMPALEALSCKKIVIASNYGGHLDFCNNENSLLVNGKEIRALKNSMYWDYNPDAIMFEPNIDDAAEKLIYAFNNKELLLENYEKHFSFIRENYTWDKVANKIINLCEFH